MDSAELTLIRRWRKKPGEAVRKLMLYLIGPEKLVHMTARGTQNKKGIPKRILNAVKCKLMPVTISATFRFSRFYQGGMLETTGHINLRGVRLSELLSPPATTGLLFPSLA